MSISKENLNNFLPNGFETENKEDYKMPFDEDLVQTGYERDVPDIVSGPNLNNLIDVVGKNTNILNKYVEYLNGMPINNVPTVNTYGQLDYTNLDDKLTKKQITNCLLEVPQRIKLELNDGTLTLKAGSQVIVPNGFEADGTTPKFDYVNVESDMSVTPTSEWATGKQIICYNRTDNYLLFRIAHASGTSPSGDYTIYYNTATNVVRDTNITDKEISLPIGFATVGNLAFTSINQVFNGMGYIGSTIWVDKGVKGLIPNGRNEDGSLKNIEYTFDRVRVTTNTISDQPNTFGIRSNGLILQYTYLGEYAVPPTAGGAWGLYYNTQEQTFYFNNNGTWKKHQVSLCGKVTYNSSLTITSFQPKLPFRAVDYNDIDGIWNGQGTVLTQNTACSSSTKTSFDLSNYLPKDGNNYEVLIDSSLEIPKGQVGKLIREIIYTSIQNDFYLVGVSSDYNNYPSSSVGNAHCAVGPDRKLNVKFTGSTGTGTYSLYARGYRKIR